MNDFDKEIKKVMTKEIELSEDFKNGIRSTIDKIQTRRSRNTGYRFFSVLRFIFSISEL